MYYLGLDGGGTGCRAALADATGRVIGRGNGGPANVQSDRAGAVDAIRTAVMQALGPVDPGQVSAVMGLAGADLSGAADWLPAALPLGRVRVVHDSVTALQGALGDADGIVAAIGTGSVFSRRLNGQVTTIGGWGPILGDEGSGNWIGRRYLAQVLRARHGLDPQTPLVQATLARHGGAAAIVRFAQAATGADFAAEVPQLLNHPDDPLTESVLDQAATEVAQWIGALQPTTPLHVTFTGGLGSVLAARLPQFEQRPALGSALDGALALAQRGQA